MLYREIPPAAEVAESVKCIWLLEHDYRGPFHKHEHLWADADIELMFVEGEPYYFRMKSRKKILPAQFVIGPFKRTIDLYSDGFTSLIAVRFWPWGAYGF